MSEWIRVAAASVVAAVVSTPPAGARTCEVTITEEYERKVEERARLGWKVEGLRCPEGSREVRHDPREGALTVRCEQGNGIPDGPFRSYYIAPNGDEIVLKGAYRAGQIHGTWRRIERDSGAVLEETGYRNGEPHGWSRRFTADGSLATEILYRNGHIDGPYRDYGPDGQLLREYWYDDGVPDGDWRSWHVNGTPLSLRRYENGVQQGESRQWHPNGQLREVAWHRDGVLDGPYSQWDASGRRLRQGRYRNGHPAGVWTLWDASGDWRYQDFTETGNDVRKASLTTTTTF